MTPEMLTVIGSGIITFVTGGIAWGKVTTTIESNKTLLDADIKTNRVELDSKIDRHIKDDEKIEKDIKADSADFWRWKNSFEKDQNEYRMKEQEQMGNLKAALSINTSQYEGLQNMIKAMTESMNRKFEQLDTKIESLRR